MKIISYAHTTPALLAASKTCTRRDWNAGYAATFAKGDEVQAWDRSPRFHGKHVADVRLTARPVLEPISAMPNSDYEAEGFAWLAVHPEAINTKRFGCFTWADFLVWRGSGVDYWVIRFEVLRVHEPLAV